MWWRYREEISREMYLREGPSITLYANNDIWKKREIIIVMMMTNCGSSNALTSNIIFGDSWEDHHLSLLGCTVLHKWLIILKKNFKKRGSLRGAEVSLSGWIANVGKQLVASAAAGDGDAPWPSSHLSFKNIADDRIQTQMSETPEAWADPSGTGTLNFLKKKSKSFPAPRHYFPPLTCELSHTDKASAGTLLANILLFTRQLESHH